MSAIAGTIVLLIAIIALAIGVVPGCVRAYDAKWNQRR